MPSLSAGLFVLWLVAMVTFKVCYSQTANKEVVVVGGGIAGLSAARQIANHGRGRYSVRVFEARRERYGGRVWTDRLNHPKARGLEVDMGGSSLNVLNPSTNPLLNLTRHLELETATISKVRFMVPWLSTQPSDDKTMQAMLEASKIMTAAVNATRVGGRDMSMQTAVDLELQRRGVDPDSLTALLLRCMPSYVISDYSALHYQPDFLDLGYNRVILDGMGELLDRLVSGTENEIPLKISLNTAVRQVKVDRSMGKVVLRLKDGSQVTVDKVIVAVPAPVMARGDLLFDPDLPKDYQGAVLQKGISDGNKVIVEFDSAFWSDDYSVYITATRDARHVGYLQTWLNLHRLMGKPHLVGFLVGTAARAFESLTDQEVQTVVLERLRGIFGVNAVSSDNIVRISRSAWTSDQWTGGASSYPHVGSVPKLWDIYAEPLCPDIYFAGEHTIFRGHGTLHGAYTSGLRAAEQLLSGYCEQKALEEERLRKEKLEAERKKKEGAEGKNKEKGTNIKESGPDATDNQETRDEL